MPALLSGRLSAIPEPSSADQIQALLDGIPGAYERTEEARRQAARGEVVPLDDLAPERDDEADA